MPTTTIHHERDEFMRNVSMHLSDRNSGLMGAFDIITRDNRPGELLLIIVDAMNQRTWYSDDRVYNRYQDAMAAMGRYIDEENPRRLPLSWRWDG